MRLPGCRSQRELRAWSVKDLAREAGLHWETAAKADRGDRVAPSAAAKIIAAFERTPVSDIARELLGVSAQRSRSDLHVPTLQRTG